MCLLYSRASTEHIHYTLNVPAIKQMCIRPSDVVLRNHFPLIQSVRHVVQGLKSLQKLHEIWLAGPRKQKTFQNMRERSQS